MKGVRKDCYVVCMYVCVCMYVANLMEKVLYSVWN